MLEPRTPRRRRKLAVALATLAALYLAALAAASSAPAERALRDRIHGALRARLGEVRVGEDVAVDPLFRVSFGPVEIPGPHGGPPLLRAAQVRVRASALALLRGRVEPASVLLGDVRLRPGPDGRDLRALVERVRARRSRGDAAAGAGATAGELPKLKLRGLVVAVPLGDEALEVGPIDADLRVTRADAAPRLRADVSLRSGGRLALEAAYAGGRWRATLHGEDLGPDALPPELRGRAAEIAAADATLDVEAEAPADLSRATATVSASVEGLVVAGERIGAEPVGPLRATASAHLAWDRASRRIVLSEGTGTFLRAASGTASAVLHLGPPATLTAELRADDVDWDAFLAALPPAVSPPPQAPRPAGKLSARLDLSGPLRSPEAWTVSASLDLSALREAARRAGRSPLAETFLHRPFLDGGGYGPELRVGPSNPDFVPIAELPEYVVRAVTTSEDAGFFGHSGFDFDELRNAIAAGARRGRLVRGGSTISQQVAKNLFLDPERTFTRKVREAAITVGLEATLPKRRILEIYLNVAEWGPGVWGIGPAARLWFGKDARALTPREAAFLATVIPSPVRSRALLLARGLTARWDERVRELLLTMNRQGALDDAQLAAALDQPLVFASAPPGEASASAATAGPVPAALSPDELGPADADPAGPADRAGPAEPAPAGAPAATAE